MLLNLNQETEPHKKSIYKLAAVISGGLLLLVLVAALKSAESAQLVFGQQSKIGMVQNLGKMLFHEFLLPFEIVSVLLLAAMVGAVMLGKSAYDERQTSPTAKAGNAKTSNLKSIANE
jgi:NADH-quinone oxidoreductase subunit J